ncbi:MAG: nitroreductase family protein [Firmicutes bacterium]|nr:nitroreductase family protein [Bacillota bacterium]
MSFEKLIHERYSVRKFKDVQVEKEKLDKILQAGRIAPTARNSQSQRFKVLTSAEDLASVDVCSPCRFNAPLVILICYDLDKAPKDRAGNQIGEMDATIAMTQMMYQAWDIGIGSCWVRHMDFDKTRELFNLPENLIPISFLPLGYATDECTTSLNHGKRMSIEEFLF